MKNSKKTSQPVIGKEVAYEIIGHLGRNNIGGIEMLESILERWIVRGLKQYPVLLGIGTTAALSTDSHIQLEAHSIFIDSLQSSVEHVLRKKFTQILRAQGNSSEVIFQLKRVNSLVRQRRAETRRVEAETYGLLLADRLITRQEARELLRASDDIFQHLNPELPSELSQTSTDEILSMISEAPTPEPLRIMTSRKQTIAAIKAEDDTEPELFVPLGSGTSLEQIIFDEVTDNDIAQATDLWDNKLTAYSGLLNANPIGEDLTEIFETVIDDYWEWRYDDYLYYDIEDDIEVDRDEQDNTSDILIDLLSATTASTTDEMLQYDISVQRWLTNMQDDIVHNLVSQYLLGRGGRNVLDKQDIDTLVRLIDDQFQYLYDFAEQIRLGELTSSKIANRSKMYMEAGTQAFERGKAKSYNVVLTQYPGDGNQNCLVRCRCHWNITKGAEDDSYVEAFWQLNASAKHCATCLNNAKKWSPYIAQIK